MADRSQLKLGYFLFSLDTELAWGYFDLDHIRHRKFARIGWTERRAIERLLDVLDEFNIVATWAVVGHLFYEQCEECAVCPIMDWKGRYAAFEEVYRTDSRQWYGADIVETLLKRGSRHEIAFHGYTHKPFDENAMNKEDVRIEIAEWQRAAKRKGIVPHAVVFPRNQVGHLDVFEEAGFICYRGDQVMPRMYSIPFFGKLLNRVDLVLQIFTPQVYELEVESSGLVNLPSSRWLFGMNRNVELILDSLHLHRLRMRNVAKGVHKAANENKVIHIWAHPFEFQSERDFDKLRYLFTCVRECVDEGRLFSVGMTDLARIAYEAEKGD